MIRNLLLTSCAIAASVLASPGQVASDRDLVVAIYGGGVASATLLQALKGQPHLDVQYFDPALNLTPTSFRLLGLDPKSHDALALISDEAGGAIDRAGWFAEEPSLVVIGQGEEADTVVLDWAKLPNTTHHPQVTVVDPASYLMQMLNGTEKSRLHPNKTLVSITQNSEHSQPPLELKFQDGTIVHADVLIGDDSEYGIMRREVLGAEHPATAPVFMNFLSAVAHVTSEQAKKYLGPKYGRENADRRFEHVGHGSWFVNAYMNTFATCLGSFYTEEEYDLSQFTRASSADEIRARFGGFKGGEGISKALSSFSGLRLIPEIEHKPAPTYIKGLVAMQGNAAHLMTNFQQLGPGQQLEDAMILGVLLGEARGKSDIEAALHAYDVVRRPRTQWVSEHGKRLGWLWTGMVEDVGLDAQKLKAALLKWKADSEAFDLKEHKLEALKIMKEALAAKSTGDYDREQSEL